MGHVLATSRDQDLRPELGSLRGKKSIILDLTTQQGKETLLRLVKLVDVVVENFVPGTMKRLGLDYEVIKQHNS
jgi:crotonobetainyl-CoA:carnitine CoA-transferase CaiB-like acyl-CoA transferase